MIARLFVVIALLVGGNAYAQEEAQATVQEEAPAVVQEETPAVVQEEAPAAGQEKAPAVTPPAKVEEAKPVELPKPIRYDVVPARSWLRFEATQSDAIVRGEFKDFKAEILFHPENPEASHVRVTVGIARVESAAQDMLTNLFLPDWLSAAKFPKAVFESKEIIRVSPNHFLAKGELTLKGVTKPVDLNFMYTPLDLNAAMVEGSTTLERLDFSVGEGEWKDTTMIKNEVVVRFKIEALQVAE